MNTKSYIKTRSGRNASQNAFELNSFIALLIENGVRNYLEIGARHGDTFHEIMMAIGTGGMGLAVDLPGGLWGTFKSRLSLCDAITDLQERGIFAECLFADSQQSETALRIKDAGPFDAILIDGDHTLEGVSRDWSLYQGLAPIIAFHDIVGTGQIEKVGGRYVEVPVFWNSIKDGFEHLEFIDEGSAMGIGVLLCG